MFNDLSFPAFQNPVVRDNSLIVRLVDSLETNDLNIVKFKTKTGTMREMACTRVLSAIPEFQHDGRFEPQLNREQIICVYDFTNSAWRAFRKDSVVSFRTV